MASLQEKMDRLDSLIDRKLASEEAEQRRADATLEEARRQRQRAHAEERRQIQATYADAFQSFGTEVPMPIDDEAPLAFRKRLFDRLVRKLAPGHNLSDLRADELGPSPTVFDNFERMIIEAAMAEGLKPSFENLPPSGELVARHRVDAATGEKHTDWYGRKSFIYDLGRPARRVERIVDRRSGSVIWGAAFPSAR
jgi:hypothetical protein